MLSENEVEQLISIPEVNEIVRQLYQEMAKEESAIQGIGIHDFFSGMLVSPSIAMARVDGATSLIEELTINKKARRISKGGFFLTQDPVVKLVGIMQNRWDIWESKLLGGLSKVVAFVTPEITEDASLKRPSDCGNSFFLAILRSSYLLVRLIETFFLPEGEVITNTKVISKNEFQKMIDIGAQLKLDNVFTFQSFIKTFEVK